METGHHRLSRIDGNNILSPNRALLVAGIIEGYEINIAKIISGKIYDRAISTDTILEFP